MPKQEKRISRESKALKPDSRVVDLVTSKEKSKANSNTIVLQTGSRQSTLSSQAVFMDAVRTILATRGHLDFQKWSEMLRQSSDDF